MLISMVYVSSAVHLMSNAELRDILRVSRENNAVRSVTGMLLYMGGNFMQVLEGEEAEVLSIFSHISADPRHREIIVLAQEPLAERQFANWQMAFVNLDDETTRREPAYSDFLRDDLTAELYRTHPNRAYIMLLKFRDTMQ